MLVVTLDSSTRVDLFSFSYYFFLLVLRNEETKWEYVINNTSEYGGSYTTGLFSIHVVREPTQGVRQVPNEIKQTPKW